MVNGLSAAVLAGGRSSRMGIDKAFLRFNGRPFVQVIAEKLSSFSDDVMVIVGRKDPLCSVYSSDALKTVDINDVKAVRDMVNLLPDAVFVDAEGFREIDPELSSFRNVNTTEDYLKLNDSARKVIDL
mgnify:CR=1 FL=1